MSPSRNTQGDKKVYLSKPNDITHTSALTVSDISPLCCLRENWADMPLENHFRGVQAQQPKCVTLHARQLSLKESSTLNSQHLALGAAGGGCYLL